MRLQRSVCGLGSLKFLFRPFVLLWLVWLIPLAWPTIVTAQPTGYQEYYVLGYEEHVWRAFRDIYEGPSEDIPGQICSTVSLVATAHHQVIYYDHWEDGYEADLLNPLQPTTHIFGDQDPSNGGWGSDVLMAGDDVSLTSDLDLSGPAAINGYVPVDPQRDPADLRYDGGDRIISSGGPVDLTHAMWPLGKSWVGGAWEIYSRQAYSRSFSYRMPIGEDLYAFGGGDTGIYGDLRNVYLQLSAFEDNTTVTIENRSEVVNVWLDRGSTYSSMGYIDSHSAPSIAIQSGTTVRSSKPVQVGLITGADSRGGDGFQGRFFIVLSDRLWGADYVLPVPSGKPDDPITGEPGDEAEIYLANPNDFPITINAYDAFTQTNFAISPSTEISATVPYSLKRGGEGHVPQDTAVRFTSSEGVFGVVVAADTSDIRYDWGYAGIPAKFLTRDYYVSWAPGTTDLSDNGSPVWVTPLADATTFYVDFTPLDGVADETFTLNVLQQRRIFGPHNDNTGTHIWATGEFAMVWGEDPRTAGPSSPFLDMGVATLPLLQRWLDPMLTLEKTADPTTLPIVGGTVTFTLVAASHGSPLAEVDLADSLPVNWSYVPGSAYVRFPDGRSENSVPLRSGQDLFWDLSTDLDVHQSLKLTFQAQITQTGGVALAAYDGFESGDYEGGANWVGNWSESGDDGSPGAGAISIVESDSPFAGGHHLQIRSPNNSIARSADLAEFVAPTLHFARRTVSLEAGDVFYLDVFDGVDWVEVFTWTDGNLENLYVREIVDLSPYAGNVAQIRFRSGAMVGDADYLYIDELHLLEGVGISTNQGEAVGKDPYSQTLFNPSDEAVVHISPLRLTKSVSSHDAEIGDTLIYTLSYANLGSDFTATNVLLRDAVPIQSVSFLKASSGGTYVASSGAVNWNLGTLMPGASGVVTFSVQVNGFVEDGTVLKNAAYLESDQTRAGSNEVGTTIAAPSVELSKSGPAAGNRGQVITYTLSYRNVGGGIATGVVIVDEVSPSTDYVGGSLAINTGNGWVSLSDASGDDQGAFITNAVVITPGINAGALYPDESGLIRFLVRIRDDLPPASLVLNRAVIRRDLDIPRVSNTVSTPITDLQLGKRAEQEAVAPGQVISYSLTYSNLSHAATHTDVFVVEPIPSFTHLVPGTVYGADKIEYSWDNGTTWNTTLPITPVTHIRWYEPILLPQERGTVGFAVRLNATIPPNTTIGNTARITSTQTAADYGDWIPSNDVVVKTVDLWVEKLADQSSAAAGEMINYVIHYGNRGSAHARDVRIEDTMPTDIMYVPGSIWGPGADDSGNPDLVWFIETVTAGASYSVVGFEAMLVPDLDPGTIITNTSALVSAYGVLESAPVTITVGIPVPPILSMDKRASAETVVPRQPFTYTVRVVNDGGLARNLTISDVVPEGTSYLSCGGAPCGIVNGTLVWGPLDLQGSATPLELDLSVLVDDGLPDGWKIVNADYRLIADNAPLLVGNPVTTTVHAPAFNLFKWASRPEVFAGSRLEYSISVNNSGGRANHLVVSDTLPANTYFDGCDCTVAGMAGNRTLWKDSYCGAPFTCDLDMDTVVWRVNEMAGGRTLQMTFWVTVDPGLADGALLINKEYAVTADYVPAVVGTAAVTTTVRRLGIAIAKTAVPDPVLVGEVLNYTITVSNEGGLLQNLSVTDLLPSGVYYVLNSCGGALCEYTEGGNPEVKWWLPNLAAGDKRELKMRVLLGNELGDELVNEFYSVWIPEAGRRVWGEPAKVTVERLLAPRFYLPVLLVDGVP